MILKTLVGIINRLSIFVFAIVFIACSNSLDNKNKLTKDNNLQFDSLTNINNALIDINLVDSIRHLLIMSVSNDTFEYQAFYNDDSPYELLYFKTGNIFNSKSKNAIALYTTNDTTVLCELFYWTDDRWIKTENTLAMHISRFSPAYFNVWFDDYNFDGNKDLKINFYHSMGVVYSYGYILTFNQKNKSLTLHPETIEIPSLAIDKKSKRIISTEYSNPNATFEKYKIVSHYGWTNDTLKLISTKKIIIK